MGLDEWSANGSSGISDVSCSPAELGSAQNIVKTFVRTVVRGMTLNVLSSAGGAALCVVQLDRKLTTLSIQRAAQKDARRRSIPLEDITEIVVGVDIVDGVDLPVDELCVTLMLREGGQAISFRFGDADD